MRCIEAACTLAALKRSAGGSAYPVGLVIAPIMPIADCKVHYGDLLDRVAATLDFPCDLTVELITHRFTPTSKQVLQGWYPNSSVLGSGILVAFAVAATIASFQFARPVDCRELCREPIQAPCPDGACRFGEQRAGLPLPMVRDAETGSPTGGWGSIGEEDYLYLNPLAFLGNLLFYGSVIWLLWNLPLALRRTTARRALIRLVPPLIYVSIVLVAARSAYQPPPPWQPPTGPPSTMLLGTWRGSEPVSGEIITLRFYDDQQVLWSRSSDASIGAAEYRWVDDQTVQVSFEERAPGTEGMCDRMLSLLTTACQSQLVRATASPVGGEETPPAATPQARTVQPAANDTPTPTLPPYDLTISTLDALVTVIVDAERLTLPTPDGTALTLQRVTGS